MDAVAVEERALGYVIVAEEVLVTVPPEPAANLTVLELPTKLAEAVTLLVGLMVIEVEDVVPDTIVYEPLMLQLEKAYPLEAVAVNVTLLPSTTFAALAAAEPPVPAAVDTVYVAACV